jgi:hypothetical protein
MAATTTPLNMSTSALLSVIDACDNLTPQSSSTTQASIAAIGENIVPLHLTPDDGEVSTLRPIGWIRESVAVAMRDYYSGANASEPVLCSRNTRDGRRFWSFGDGILDQGMDKVTQLMAKMVRHFKDAGLFPECLDGASIRMMRMCADSLRRRYCNQVGETSYMPSTATHPRAGSPLRPRPLAGRHTRATMSSVWNAALALCSAW